MLSRADAICEAELSLDEIATLGLLRGQLGSTVEAFALAEQCRSRFFPFGFADLPAQLAQSTALETVAARDAFARRLEAMPMFFRDSLFLLRAGLNNGYYLPRILVSRLLASLDGHLGADGLASIVDRRLAEPIPGSAPEIIARQRQRMDAIVQQAVLPALQDVRDAIAELDEKQLTDKIGLCDQPDGLAYYRYKARQQTSLDIDVLEIHEIGKTEVTRIHAEIDAVLLDMGRPGQRREVAAELDATVAPDGEALLIKVRAFAKKIDGLMPRLFGRLPGITYAVEQLEVGASAALPPALAQPSPADRTMPGIFWLTALPEKCPLHLVVPLTLHEAWPGHLMQFALAHETTALPAFRRYGWTDYNGYVEGWALYCERLGFDLGLYDDPADRFGLLTFELWRSARLVVDTGIHALGWTRDQAIDYMTANTFLPAATIDSEVDRYIGLPAQALSYKLGERILRALREEAQGALGDRFSLRAFHDAILATGPVSLNVLEQHMRRWIAAQIVA